MDNLDGLESALWEAHGREARAVALLETRNLRAHNEQLTQVDPTAFTTAVGDGGGSREDKVEHDEPPPMTTTDSVEIRPLAGAAAPEASTRSSETIDIPTATLPTVAECLQEAGRQGEAQTEDGQKGQRFRHESLPGTRHEKLQLPFAAMRTAASAVATAVTGAVVVDRTRSNRELVGLRSDLGRHLAAVAHVVDRGRHLKEATRVMREIDKLEARDKAEVGANARGGLGTINLETATLLQKQAQAKEVQADKHHRLRRALESLGVEELRLLSARQKGSLGRLAAHSRERTRRRQMELRGKLAAVKRSIAREWREHNRSHCRRSGGLLSSDDVDEGASRKRRAATGRGGGGGGGGSVVPSAGQHQDPVHGKKRGGGDTGTDVSDVGEREAEVGTIEGGEGDAGIETGGGTERGAKEAGAGPGKGEGPDGGISATGVNLVLSGNHEPDDLECTTGTLPLDTVSAAAVEEKSEDGTGTVPDLESGTNKAQAEVRTAVPATQPNQPPAPTAGFTIRASKDRGERRLRTRRKRVAARAAAAYLASAADTSLSKDTANDALTAGGGTFSVLSEEEAQALAALGRGAPSDARLLLLVSSPSPARDGPQQHQFESSSRAYQGLVLHEESEQTAEVQRDGSEIGDYHGNGDGGDDEVLGVGGVSGGGTTTSNSIKRGGSLEKVLDSAMNKLAREIQAEHDLSRRQLGMTPVPSW
ncbi:unnamed protein product [Ectocarpus sp. CCAP 1310/34]|nr:unnamed protein product [Ectocarpus sp. CCAP 1310/34]